MEQLQAWQGHFGEAYTRRNVVDWHSRVDGWAAMLDGLEVETVLEVGANRGHNLQALESLGYTAIGVEPQPFARNLAKSKTLNVIPGDAYMLPFPDACFDLVFTSGVLIHVPPQKLETAIHEIARVSSRYILAVEYHADTDTEILYRGQTEMLWKRDYAAHYLASVPGLELVATADAPDGFEDATYVVLAKSDKSG